MEERATALVGPTLAAPRVVRARFRVSGPMGYAGHFSNPLLAMSVALSRSMDNGGVYVLHDGAARLCVAIDGALFAADGLRPIAPVEAVLAAGRR